MAEQSSQRKDTRCSLCGGKASRVMLKITTFTYTAGWQCRQQLCWQCSVDLLMTLDYVRKVYQS